MDEPVPAHRDARASSSRESASEPRVKVGRVSGKHSIYTHFPKDKNCDICMRTKITRTLCRKRTGAAMPRAEKCWWLDNGRSQDSQWRMWISKQSPTCCRGTYRIWQLNGFNHTCSKQKLLRKQRTAYKSSWSRRGNQKSFTLSIPWNSAKLLKTYLGIIVRQHLTVQKQIWLMRERHRVKEGASAVLLQSCLDEKWWVDSLECYCYLRNIQDLLSDGKTPHERRFGEPFQGPLISFRSMVECHPMSAKDLSRLHQFGPEVLPGIFLGYELHAGGIWEGDKMVADTEELERLTHLKFMLGDSMRRQC